MNASSLYFKIKAAVERSNIDVKIDRRRKFQPGSAAEYRNEIVLGPRAAKQRGMKLYAILAHEYGHVISYRNISKHAQNAYDRAYQKFYDAQDAIESDEDTIPLGCYSAVIDIEERAWDIGERLALQFIERSNPLFAEMKTIRRRCLSTYKKWASIAKR